MFWGCGKAPFWGIDQDRKLSFLGARTHVKVWQERTLRGQVASSLGP